MNQIAHNVPSLVDLVEQGWVPDLITRLGMRGLNHKRLWDEGTWHAQRREERQRAFMASFTEGLSQPTPTPRISSTTKYRVHSLRSPSVRV